jgi:hypothetical protein
MIDGPSRPFLSKARINRRGGAGYDSNIVKKIPNIP